MKRLLGIAIFVGVSFVQSEARAAAPDKAQCADAYESSQRLERAGKLAAAIDAAAICASASCPDVLRADCVAWLSPLRARQASLVVEAHDPLGREIFEVKVQVDGQIAQERLDGRAFLVDPGKHVLTFEARGFATEERVLVAREGEQGRRVVVAFSGAPSATVAGADRAPESGRLPTASWLFGGVGVVALGVFGGFGLSGKSFESKLDRECSPRCADARVDDLRTQYIVADVALGVGIVSLGVATWLALTHRASR